MVRRQPAAEFNPLTGGGSPKRSEIHVFLTIIKVALKCLWANKLRSFLAMLGIIIGVGAVISMLAIGTGAQKQVIGPHDGDGHQPAGRSAPGSARSAA